MSKLQQNDKHTKMLGNKKHTPRGRENADLEAKTNKKLFVISGRAKEK
jgi:hypothetical protein